MARIVKILNYIPVASEAVASADHTFSNTIHALRADEDGTCSAKLSGDTASQSYTLTAGDYLYGNFTWANIGTFGAGKLIGYTFPLE